MRGRLSSFQGRATVIGRDNIRNRVRKQRFKLLQGEDERKRTAMQYKYFRVR
jgi:hypothetical protein